MAPDTPDWFLSAISAPVARGRTKHVSTGTLVDAAVESVLAGIESHRHGLLGVGGARAPHRGRTSTRGPENPTLEPGRVPELVEPLGRASAHPNEAMMSIQAMKLTGPALRLFEAQCPCSRPGNLSLSFGVLAKEVRLSALKIVVSQSGIAHDASLGSGLQVFVGMDRH